MKGVDFPKPEKEKSEGDSSRGIVIDFRNLWLNLTIAVPGMVTYGLWRIVVMIMGYRGIDFETIDGSVVLVVSIIIMIAVLQQLVGITLEYMAGVIVRLKKNRIERITRTKCNMRYFDILLLGHPRATAKELFNEKVTRIVAQFYLSLNVSVGQLFILTFIIFAQNPSTMPPVDRPIWLILLSTGITLLSIFVAIYRSWCAAEAIRALDMDDKFDVENFKK